MTRKYIEAAKKVVPEFGVAAECGGGRMEWKAFEDMLKICSQVSQPVVALEPQAEAADNKKKRALRTASRAH